MLTPLDWVVICVYLLGTIVVGLWYGGSQRDADDYFTGGGRMNSRFQSGLVGLSIAATLFSGISFIAYPSIVYQHGVAVLIGLISFPICWVVLKYWFLPRFLGPQHHEPYQMIEDRFGPSVRTLAAGMFLLLRVGWMAALIYAPTIALMGAAGLDRSWFWMIALTIGISSTLYTTLGGIRGVIVTDALQFLVVAGGIVLVFLVILWRIPEPWGVVWQGLGDSGRLDLLKWSASPFEPFTVWAMVIGFTISNLSIYQADQMSLQRYLSCGDTPAAIRSFTINVVGVMVVIALLGLVGLGLAAWYATVPATRLPENPDQVFPFFVASELPAGLTGLVLAAVLAATMSSMTSGINTLSATLTLDFRARFGPPMTPTQQLRFARVASLVVGLVATALAGLVSYLGDIFDIAQTLLGAFLGPLLACVVLCLCRSRIEPRAVWIGMLAGCGAAWGTAFSPIQSLWVAPVAFAVSIAVAFAAGPVLPRPHPARPEADLVGANP